MDVEHRLAGIASAIAEPARARMLCSMLDRRARTPTELAAISELGASTTSAHLARLVEQGLLRCIPQGRYRYYLLANDAVGAALESLLVMAGGQAKFPSPRTPARLRWARTCYDHLAGSLAVTLFDRMLARGWLEEAPNDASDYGLSVLGEHALEKWGVDTARARTARRRFARACLDWSERKPHLGEALGAELLGAALDRGWLHRDMDDRAVRPTPLGYREWLRPLDIVVPDRVRE